MWQLVDQVRELQQHGPMQLNGRLLLVRCRLLRFGAPVAGDSKHQELVIELLLRMLRRQLGQRELTFQTSETDILVVLMTRPVADAIAMIKELIAELRRHLLGDGDMPPTAITVEELKIDANGAVTTTELLAIDGTINEEALREETPPELDPKKVLIPRDLRYSFTPVWDVKRKAVTTYYLRCHGIKVGFSGEQTGYGMLHGVEESSSVPDLDFMVLERAAAELGLYRDGKMPFVLVWPLHTRTIENVAKYQRYAETMATLAPFIQSRMVVAVHGIRHDWPVSRMQWVIGTARRYCRAVTVHLPFDTGLLAEMASCGVTNVSFSLEDQVDNAALLPRLRKQHEAASKQGLICVAHRVPSRAVAIAAVSAGFSFVHADFLGAGAKPEPAFRYDVIDLINASADLGMTGATMVDRARQA